MSVSSPKHTVITRAGNFPVRQVPVRHYPNTVNFSRPRCAVLHTVEGTWAGGMAILTRHYAPHFMLGLNNKKAEIVQFVPIGFIGAALRANNDQALVQVEMVGFSKEKPWLPDGQTLDALCSLMNVCEREWGIPRAHPWPDNDWGRAGERTPHRASGKFGHIAGWYGHQDVPENTHWDVGALQWSRVFDRCHELEAATEVA